MKDFDFDELIKEYMEKDEKRKAFLREQIQKGCDKCSQWDDYWGVQQVRFRLRAMCSLFLYFTPLSASNSHF